MDIFSVPPDLPVTKSKEEIDKTYRYWRMHLLVSSYIHRLCDFLFYT